MTVEFTCSFPPGPRSVEWAQLAESLGYRRVYLHDSPALYWDVWVALSQVAEHTDRIGLGALVIPSLRHVLVTASAAATIEDLAPGRLAVVVGTGFTGRVMLGKRPLSWSSVERYVRQLRGLLHGDEVEVDGAVTAMRHPKGWAPARPIEVPVIVAANGPRGIEVAHEDGDGIFCMAPVPGFERCVFGTAGTVLREGEVLESPRVVDAVGPALALNYHYTYEMGGEAVDQLPGGKEWRESVEQFPERSRHLYVHEGHGVAPNERERPFLNPHLAQFTTTGSEDDIRKKFAEYEAAGVTELAYAPMGSDIPGELRAMARVAGISG
jgi:5,10-methylenetetrahydromethanopterin reductase